MNILKNHIKNGEFNHAYLLAGDFDLSRESVFEAAGIILESSEIKFPSGVSKRKNLETHPDFFYFKSDLFGVDDSCILRQKASQKSMLGGAKVFVVEVVSFTLESASALLKVFEEPFEGTHFFVIVPFREDVLPTLASRLTIIDNSHGGVLTGEDGEICKKFMVSLPSKRIDEIKNFAKDRYTAVNFLNKLEIFVAKELDISTAQRVEPLRHSVAERLGSIQKNREFLYTKGSSAKMVLEHLALTLPRVN